MTMHTVHVSPLLTHAVCKFKLDEVGRLLSQMWWCTSASQPLEANVRGFSSSRSDFVSALSTPAVFGALVQGGT